MFIFVYYFRRIREFACSRRTRVRGRGRPWIWCFTSKFPQGYVGSRASAAIHTDEPLYQAKTSGVPWTPWRADRPYLRRPCGDPLNPLHVRWRLRVKVEDPVARLVNQAACRLRRVPGLPRCHRRRHSQQTRNRFPSRPWGCLRRRGRTRWRRGRRSGVWCVFLSLRGSVEWECGTDAGVSYHSVSRN